MRAPKKAFPLGGRWHGEAVTDEGTIIARFFVGPDALIGPLDGSFRRGISPPAGGRGVPPCGAGFFLDAQKETKEAPGRGSG